MDLINPAPIVHERRHIVKVIQKTDTVLAPTTPTNFNFAFFNQIAAARSLIFSSFIFLSYH